MRASPIPRPPRLKLPGGLSARQFQLRSKSQKCHTLQQACGSLSMVASSSNATRPPPGRAARQIFRLPGEITVLYVSDFKKPSSWLHNPAAAACCLERTGLRASSTGEPSTRRPPHSRPASRRPSFYPRARVRLVAACTRTRRRPSSCRSARSLRTSPPPTPSGAISRSTSATATNLTA
jgi:hypothetical protein